MTCTSRTQTNTPRLFGEARAIIHRASCLVNCLTGCWKAYVCRRTCHSMFVHSYNQVAARNLKNGQYFNIDRNRSLVLDMMISLQLKQTQSTIIIAVIANVVGFYHTYTSNLMHWEFTALVKSFCTGSTSSRQLKSV